jgi:hypothetical protein
LPDDVDTTTVVLCLAVPALPVQVSVYVVVCVSAGVDFDPLIARLPDQPPEAVQALALVEVQVSIDVAPLEMLDGLALKETVGAAAATVTVTDWDAEPPLPWQVSVKSVVLLRATVVCEPRKGSAPVQPPDATQLVASVDDHSKVAVDPLFTVVGLAEIVTVGAGVVTVTVTAWVATPPGPEQVRE